MRRSRSALVLAPALLLALGGACGGGSSGSAASDAGDAAPEAAPIRDASIWDGTRIPYEASAPQQVPRTPVSASLVSTTVDAQAMLFAAGEMQISGEPFAQFFAGRNLAYYDRAFLPVDRYLLPVPGEMDDPDAGIVFDALVGSEVQPVVDLFGFSTAVESYEYSKYHMNSIVEWGSTGLSFLNGPLVEALPGPKGQPQLIARIVQLLTLAGTDVGGYAVLPPPTNNPANVLGFAGLTPVFAPFAHFDPAIVGSQQEVQSCNRVGGYGGIPMPGNETPEYECEYNQLHVPDAAQDHVLVPAVLGFATWKQALWAIDFAGRMHDAASNPVNTVAASDQKNVGAAGNTVVATDPPGAAAGTYLGSTPLEGMWGLDMLAGMDNLGEFILRRLTTADGKTLGGFGDASDARSKAIQYDFGSPLRWFPAAVTASVDAGPPDGPNQFPPLTGLALTDGSSRSVDLAALMLGDAMLFAMSDLRNQGIDATHTGLPVVFDGDHGFDADDGMPDGEPTVHDRSLGVLRVALVDLVRLHQDPASGVFVDSATAPGGKIARGSTVTTTDLAHVLVGLRQSILSLNAAVTQYGSADESPAADAQGILNSVPIHPPGGGTPTFCTYVRSIFTQNAAFVRDVLTTASGAVANGATLASGKATPTTTAATLDTQAAAARALTEAYLLTGDVTYQARAQAVVRHLVSAFFSPPAQMFIGVEGQSDVSITMTPEIYGWLQSALRETYKSLAIQGDPVLDHAPLEALIARIGKLYLNGWDDLNGNRTVDQPSECLGARMQLAEQSLTGELGRDAFGLPTPDRDSDCVIELGHAGPSAAFPGSLAVFVGQVTFHSP